MHIYQPPMYQIQWWELEVEVKDPYKTISIDWQLMVTMINVISYLNI